ncbi:hypothetical protein C8Q75DRAFT_782027 [Abortiporus biennis]|nr:hypothetical protein C8Q75DRAFT_782027 [Abortiporus biennis]
MEFSVSTDKDRGAVLFLGKPANADRVMDNDAFKSYMFDNHRDWITFAKDTFSVTLKPDQLLFVNATTTTDSHWATVAWSSSSRSQKVEYNAESPSVSSSIVNVKVKYNKTTVAEVPFSRSRTDIKRSTVKDHCIFISGYKMKHRLFKSGFKVEAAAGAHNLSDNDDDDEDLSSGYSPNLVSSNASVLPSRIYIDTSRIVSTEPA